MDDYRHGGPYDRGAADSYYGRSRVPHYYTNANYQSEEVTALGMTEAEIAEYNLGYDENDECGMKKEW